MIITRAFIKLVNANPLSIIKDLTSDDVGELLFYLNEKYFNETPEVSDEIYDIIRDYMNSHFPDHPVLKIVGAPVHHNKVDLPYWMGSMDKKKTSEEIITFTKKYKKDDTFVLSDKLDGVSALLYRDDNNTLHLYTRGNGSIGQDISHLLPFLKLDTIIQNSNFKNARIAIRGELVISRDNFQTVKHLGANARNMVSGLVNAKNPDFSLLRILDFVAYEVIYPSLKPEDQFKMLSSSGFNIASNKIVNISSIEFESLGKYLLQRKTESIYEIDGIIVSDNVIHEPITSGNPTYSFAFKTMLSENIGTVTVIDVEWNSSRHGFLKPRVMYTPIELGGVTLQYATGYNAKFIVDNVIGPGAVITITRSGDVIPKILSVIKPAANNKPKMPGVTYEWTETGVDIKLKKYIKKKGEKAVGEEGEDEGEGEGEGDRDGEDGEQQYNKDSEIKVLVNFFKKIGTVGLNIGMLTKLYDSGYTNVKKILNIKISELREIPTIKDKMSEKLYENIHESIGNINGLLLMAGSNSFGIGFGERKLKVIVDTYLDICYNRDYLKKNKIDLINMIKELPGFSDKTSTQFVDGLPYYYEFLHDIPKKIVDTLKGASSSGISSTSTTDMIFSQMNIVFTGVRDKELEKYIIEHGGNILNAINKSTTILITKDIDSSSVKIQNAKKIGVTIYAIDDFRSKFIK
jgi:NAD-dependent DNA ligase